MTPYEVVYGQHPPKITIYLIGTSHVQYIDTILQGRTATLAALKDNLHMAQNCMKKHEDLHHSERVFQEGDQVFLRLQPYKKNISKSLGTTHSRTQFLWALPYHQVYWFSGLQIGLSNYFKNPSGVPCFLSKESGRTKLQGPNHLSKIR
jgi:hypothetical protein